jgi:hypothetical protein
METTFLFCAVGGGTLILCQLVAGLVGLGADHDTDHDHDTDQDHAGNWFVGMLSVRTISAAFLFFGLGGLTARHYGAEELAAFGIALGAGAAALYAVAMMMRSVAGLKHDGTARVERAVGHTGTVYLRVPGAKAGPGKVHLMLQNRTVEYQAVTGGNELPTGTPVRIVAIVNSDTVEVEAA